MRRRPARTALAAIAALVGCGGTPATTSTAPPAPVRGPHADALEAHLRPYRDGELIFGAAVALIDHDKVETAVLAPRDGEPAITADTWFELGSISKVYTGVLLADALERGEVQLDSAAVSLLPPGTTMPMGQRAITLDDLITHRSGLPRLPPSLATRADARDPFAGYGVPQLLQDVEGATLESEPGQRMATSMFAVAVLGTALGARGDGFASVLRSRVLAPLTLTATDVEAPAGVMATGHGGEGEVVGSWRFDALAPAAGLRSTVRDQAEFVRQNLAAARGASGPLMGALRRSHQLLVPSASGVAGTAMGWVVDEEGRRWHSGETGGYHAFIAFDGARDQGVVVLAATATAVVDKLGLDLLDVLAGKPTPPLVLPTAAQLASYGGLYVGPDNTGMRLVVDGVRLYSVDGRGAQRLRLVPLGAAEFYVTELDAQVVLVPDPATGAVLGLSIVAPGGEQLDLRKVPEAPAAPAPAS